MKIIKKVNNRGVGDSGEDQAAAFLEDNGFCILDRNYRTKIGEIDIVAEKKGVVHIVEVKTSNQKSPILPEENYTKTKSKQVLLMATLFAAHKGITEAPMQIDLIAVRLNGDGRAESINYYERVTA